MKDRKTAFQAAALWAGMMTAYLAAGLVDRFLVDFSLVIWVNIILTILCFILAARGKDGVRSLGLVRERFALSFMAGLACSAAIVIINAVIPGILGGMELARPGTLLIQLVYFMAVIAIPEEIIFRGYILSRMEQSSERKYAGVVISGIMFMLIHLPYQAVMNGGLLPLILNGYGVTLIMTFVWHIVFCILLKKTGAIYGAILFHAVMNWSNYLFVP